MSPEASQAVGPYAALLTRSADDVGADLDRFAGLLGKWQTAQNLVSRETLNTLWTRHIADSLQLLKRVRASDRHILDLGSGGGFPAIPLAIALQGSGRHSTLVESNQRKVAFLRAVARELRLDVTVEPRRAEQIDSRETMPVDLVTSRAMASLNLLCAMAVPFFGPTTHAIFHKGREYGEELAEAHARWDFDVVEIPSDTSSDGVLLEIRDLRAKIGA